MNITYQNDEIRETCHDIHYATTVYGKQVAQKIHRKLALLDAANNLSAMIQFDKKAHWLQGGRMWDFSIPLCKGLSLILTPVEKNTRAPQDINHMMILKVEDYHR